MTLTKEDIKLIVEGLQLMHFHHYRIWNIRDANKLAAIRDLINRLETHG